MRKTIAIAVAAAALTVLTACSSSSDTSDSKAATSQGATASPAADAPASLTAEAAFEKIAATVDTAKLGTVFTESSDPNKLLGRPGQYVSKVSFVDGRIAADDVSGLKEGDTARGGGVEVFETAEGAKKRADYIERVTEGVPMLAEYRYLNGPVLVRVSHYLTPSQAADYEKATASLS
jgi:hypothetical protein